MNLQNSRILILGAGQVGLETARQLATFKPKCLILHCLTEGEVQRAAKKLEHLIGPEVPVELAWGNILRPHGLAYQATIDPGSAEEQQLIDHFYGHLTPGLIQASHLYHLVNTHRSNFIVDAVNTATAVGYRHSVHEVIRDALQDPGASTVNSIARTLPTPQLVRLVQVLKGVMEEFKIERYVKVSTTGLGGMGFNIMYTHGDLGEPGLSTKLLGKVAAAGILHQLLWTLSHTPGFNVNVVIPAALIGWDEMSFRPVGLPGHNGHAPALTDCQPIHQRDVGDQESLAPHTIVTSVPDSVLRSTIVGSGENGDYSWHDMAAITAPGQMGPVTKEEVACAVIQCLQGDNRHCLLANMDQAQLLDSPHGYEKRRELLARMSAMSVSSRTPSASFGNLGPSVATMLWELEIIAKATGTFRRAMEMDPITVALECEAYIHKNDLTRQMILTVGLPVVTDNLVYVPRVSPTTLKELRDSSATVLLTTENIARWQGKFQMVSTAQPPAFSNANTLKPDEPLLPGEFLGLFFTMSGGGKKKDLLNIR